MQFDWDTRLALLLLMLKNDDGYDFPLRPDFWRQYIGYYPGVEDCPSLLLATPEELAELQDDHLAAQFRHQQARSEALYKKHFVSAPHRLPCRATCWSPCYLCLEKRSVGPAGNENLDVEVVLDDRSESMSIPEGLRLMQTTTNNHTITKAMCGAVCDLDARPPLPACRPAWYPGGSASCVARWTSSDGLWPPRARTRCRTSGTSPRRPSPPAPSSRMPVSARAA